MVSIISLRPAVLPEIADGLDGADAEAAVEAALKALSPRGEKVAGPAVEADAVDEVGGPLGGLQIVLAAGIVGVADAAVAIPVVDAVLAPDLSLADVDALFGCQVALVLGIHEASDEALRTVAAADHVGDHVQRLVNRLAVICPRVIHGCEVAAGNEGDLVAVLVVIGGEKAARVFVLLPVVVEGEPAYCPCHAAVRAASGECFSSRTDMGRAIVGNFVFADRTSWRYLDLVDPYDGDMGYESSAQRRGGWRKRLRVRRRECA